MNYTLPYNVRIKVFPDGTKQYLYCSEVKEKNFKRMLEDLPDAYLDDELNNDDDELRDVSGECAKRARQRVWDIARANHWDWFCTLTLDPACVDRFDYSSVVDALKSFTKSLHYYNCDWLIVPEQHKSGAWHFHGLIRGNPPMSKGKVLKDGTVIYNLDNYHLGFTSLSRVKNEQSVATYITKYLTKEMEVPKGRKRYWFSRGLNQPRFVYSTLPSDCIPGLLARADFKKIIHSPYGDYVLLEIHSK